MPYYECVFIARQDVASSQVDALTDRFAEMITEGGGTIGKREYWGLKNLAYRIKKNRKGHYVLLNIDAPSPALQEMERNMRLNEDVLRYLTIKVDSLEEGPSAMMQARQTRDRGPRRGGGFGRGGGRDSGRDGGRDSGRDGGRDSGRDGGRDSGRDGRGARSQDGDDSNNAAEAGQDKGDRG